MKMYTSWMCECPVPYILVLNEGEWNKVCKRLGVGRMPFLKAGGKSEAHATTHMFESAEGGTIAVVSMVPSDDVLVDYALIVHEAVHVWQAICEEIGETSPSSEFEAYSVQSICYNLFTIYKEKVNALKPIVNE
jgi:hypothetical protein